MQLSIFLVNIHSEGQYVTCMKKQTRAVQTPGMPLKISSRHICFFKPKILRFRPYVDFFPSIAILCFVFNFCVLAEANYIQKQKNNYWLRVVMGGYEWLWVVTSGYGGNGWLWGGHAW